MTNKKHSKRNVYSISEQYLCNSCGACASVCPVNAIEFHETIGGYIFPSINLEVCNGCSLCLEVCPGIHFGDTLIKNMPDVPFKGSIKHCFIGKALDNKVYTNAQSGGVVTAILLYALEIGYIQAAIVTVMKPGDPPRPEVMIAKSKEDIISAQKSKYSPVPILTSLSKIEKQNLDVGIVGTPCQIHGLYNYLDVRPHLKDNIKLKIGLICDRTMTNIAIDYLINISEFKDGKKHLYFRDKNAGGYPGSVHVKMGEKEIIKPPSERTKIKDFFTPARCRLCFDKMNVFSDITIGDPWGISKANHKNGESVVIIRTDQGKSVSNKIGNKVIKLSSVSYENVIKGQHIEKRRKNWIYYCNAWKNLGYNLPNYYKIIESKSPSKNISKKNYKDQLLHSLSLDNFDTKNKIFQRVRKLIKYRKLINRILWPYRFLKKIGDIIK